MPRNVTTFDELHIDDCLRLLSVEPVGRLAMNRLDDGPLVVPVNYVLDGDTIVFRTGPGLIADALHEQLVSFQVDSYNQWRHTGWSVLVTGVAHRLELAGIPTVDVAAWAPGQRPFLFRIRPTAITGRMLLLAEPALDPRGYL